MVVAFVSHQGDIQELPFVPGLTVDMSDDRMPGVVYFILHVLCTWFFSYTGLLQVNLFIATDFLFYVFLLLYD